MRLPQLSWWHSCWGNCGGPRRLIFSWQDRGLRPISVAASGYHDIIGRRISFEERNARLFSFHRYVIRTAILTRNRPSPRPLQISHTRVDPGEARLLVSAGQVGLCRVCSLCIDL